MSFKRHDLRTFGGRLQTALILLLGLTLASCAKPANDQSAASNKSSDQVGRQSNCPARFSISGLCLSWEWEADPVVGEPAVLAFRTFRLDSMGMTSNLQSPELKDMLETPRVILDMPSHGHGAGPTHTQRVGVGSYRTSDVEFIMPGPWVVRIEVKDSSGAVDVATFDIIL